MEETVTTQPISSAGDFVAKVYEKMVKGEFDIMEIKVIFRNRSAKTAESNAVTSEAGTAVKTASDSPSGVRTNCLPVADREDAAISQQSQLEINAQMEKNVFNQNGR